MQTTFASAPGVAGTKVELRVSCRNLVSLDYLSASDPIVRVKQFNSTKGKWFEIGRTEWQRNQKNPSFARSVPIDYFFQQVQKLRFQVYDVDNPEGKLKKQDFIGELAITLGDLLGSTGCTVSRELENRHHPRKDNMIIVQAEEVNADSANSIVSFQFSGKKLDKKDLFGKSDPYLEIYRRNPDGNYVIVHKTEVVKKNLDPWWQPFEMNVSSLCQGDFERKLLFKVWDWDSDGDADLIGTAETTLNEMLKGKRVFALIEPSRVNKKGYTDSGTLHVTKVDVRREYSFLEYISGGCQLRLAIAIDYTASNGSPTDSTSLHYRNPSGAPNEYHKAIMAIGDIVACYDHTKHFPTYGFGARVPPTNELSHCFHVNMDTTNPECAGIGSVISAYQKSLDVVKFSGPTNFATIIRQVATIARQTPVEQQVYWVLLMITDGEISDMEETKSELVAASNLPLSVIIVGVGSANFAAMNALDCDHGMLKSRTGTASRDIVQFVPFSAYRQKHYSELANATLAELPKQLTEYYKAKKIAPRPRPVVQMGLQAPMAGGAGLQAQPTGVPPQQGDIHAPQGGYAHHTAAGGSSGPYGGPPRQGGDWSAPQGVPSQGGPPLVQTATATPAGPSGQHVPGSPLPESPAPAQQAVKQSDLPPQGGIPEGQQHAGAAWSGQPQQQQWGAPPPHQQQGGWSMPPQQQQWGAPPQQQWGAPPPQQGGWGAPPPQQWGAPPQQYGWGAPPQQWGAPPQQQGGWGAPPQHGWGAPPQGAPGATPAGQGSVPAQGSAPPQ